MARLFPLRSDTSASEGQPRVVDLEDEDADAVFGALSSTTARQIYARLDDEPGTPSDVAEAIDSSIQNVRYHLEKLEDAGLVEVVDTWYSSRGNEMSVYATANGPLIVTSDESRAAKLKEAISRFLGGVVALLGGSLLVQYMAYRFFSPAGTGTGPETDYTLQGGDDAADSGGADDGGVDDAADDGETDDAADDGETDDAADDDGTDAEQEQIDEESADEDVEDVTADSTDSDGSDGDDVGTVDSEDAEPTSDAGNDAGGGAADSSPEHDAAPDSADGVEIGADQATDVLDQATDVLDAASTLPPGLLFFLGGLVVLTVVVGYWYWSSRRVAR